MMPDSGLNMSTLEADNTTIESFETEGYLIENKRSDATVKRSVIFSTMPVEINSTILKPDLTNTPEDSRDEQANRCIGDVTEPEEESHFVTGSSYKGSWDALGMCGIGRYVMPHGTAYEGEIRDGMFHGRGTIDYWPKYGRLDVVHHRGKLQEYRYKFTDGLAYDYEDWSYCKFPDRRFYESIKKGLRPGGRTLKTGKQPTKVLPSGCYDVGDGVFDPKTWCITSYDDSKKVLRIPKKEEYDWIIKNCRKSWTEPTGYRPSLNENLENLQNFPYHIAMSKDSPDSWWKRLTTFERQFDPREEKNSEDNSSLTEEKDFSISRICLCGQYVLLGEPCHCVEAQTLANDEAEVDKFAFQSEDHSFNYSDAKNIPQEKIKINFTFERRDNEVYSSKVSEDVQVDIHTLFNTSKYSSNYIYEESLGVEKDLKNQRDDGTEALNIIDERTKSTDAVENEAVEKSSVDRGKIKNVSRENVPREKISKNIPMKNKLETMKQNHFTQQEKKTESLEKNNSSIITEEKIDQDLLLANRDYATTSISREKVESLTEPETNNGRRMMSERSKLLPKGSMTERDLPFDRIDEVAIRSNVVDTLQQMTVTRSVSNETSVNITSNVTTAAKKMKKNIIDDSDDDKFRLQRSKENFEEKKEMQSTRNFYRSIDKSGEKSREVNQIKLMKNPEVSKVSEEASDYFITNEEKLSEIRCREEKQTRKMKAISNFSSNAISSITAKKDPRSRNIEEQTLIEKSSISLKCDLPILETLHHSLGDFSSEKQKPIEEMEIIEIYKKHSKDKTTSKPVDVNVWRLSCLAQHSDRQTNKKNILFDPILTLPRCEVIECMKKEPCGVEACKPALPEVRTGDSLCRKEFPFNIPVKSSCSSAGKMRRKK